MRKLIVILLLAMCGVLVYAQLKPTRANRVGARPLDAAAYVDPRRDALPVKGVVKRVAQPPQNPPNIVLIMADDLGYGDLGSYGNTIIRTPNLDQLARDGVRFTNFYASHSFCSPSRAGLLTGRYPLRTGINFPIQPASDSLKRRITRRMSSIAAELGGSDTIEAGESAVPGLPQSEITLPEALRLAGYATGMVGKWHLGDFNHQPEYHPLKHGFDFFAGFPASNDEFPYSFWRNDKVVDENLGVRQGDVTAMLTREAISFIDINKQKPFFLYFAHKNVHTPLFPSAKFAGKSAAGPYGDSVEEMDASVGEIIAALRERGLLEKTLIVFTSDNGPWHVGNPGALRGRKGQPMEGGQRVPMIAAWPGQVPSGKVVKAASMNFDFFPTVFRLTGLELPNDRAIDGRDIWPLLSGERDESPHQALFFFNANVIDGARSGPWKYYRWVNLYTWPIPLDKQSSFAGQMVHDYVYVDPKTGDRVPLLTHDPLLFNVESDTNESYNVIDSHPRDADRIRQAIEHWERDFIANPRGWH